MVNQYTPWQERFDNSYMPEPNTGCWLWTAAASPTRKGADYRPVIAIDGKQRMAYRVSYERFKGDVPDGLMICHKCNTPLCVNPDHLYAGTHKTNAADSIAAGSHNSIRDPEASRERGKNLWTLRRAANDNTARSALALARGGK